MNRTEQLRKKLAEQFYGGYCEPEDREGYEWQCALGNATQILQAFKDASGAFVVEGELPGNPYYNQSHKPLEKLHWIIHNNAQQDMLKAGYRKVELLE